MFLQFPVGHGRKSREISTIHSTTLSINPEVNMSNYRILIKDVYARPLGNQIMYWRIINHRDTGRISLEWAVVDAGRNLGVTLFKEDHPAAIAAMRKIQKPGRMVEMNNVNGFLLEHFLEWGWIQPSRSLSTRPALTMQGSIAA